MFEKSKWTLVAKLVIDVVQQFWNSIPWTTFTSTPFGQVLWKFDQTKKFYTIWNYNVQVKETNFSNLSTAAKERHEYSHFLLGAASDSIFNLLLQNETNIYQILHTLFHEPVDADFWFLIMWHILMSTWHPHQGELLLIQHSFTLIFTFAPLATIYLSIHLKNNSRRSTALWIWIQYPVYKDITIAN